MHAPSRDALEIATVARSWSKTERCGVGANLVCSPTMRIPGPPPDLGVIFIAATCVIASCGGGQPPGTSTPSAATTTPSATAASSASTPQPTGSAIASSPAPPSSASAESGTLLQQLMRSHFTQVALIRSAVVAGSIDDAIEPARLIVEMQGVHELPKVWRSAVRELQAASARIRTSPDLPEAAAATADIGMTCGGCHVELTGPTIDVGKPPPKDKTVADRMRRHLWATERLWEGLYGPSDSAWTAGANVLASDAFANDVLPKGDVLTKSIAARLVKLGKKAQTTRDGEERATIYAETLATCAPCHAKVRGQDE